MPVSLPPGPLIVGLSGPALTERERAWLAHPLLGGVILFERNVADRAQLAALTAAVHALRDPPLLVTVDQEGGRVQRLRALCSDLPAAGALRAGCDADQARARARAAGLVMAAECRTLGVDLSFAPVLDLDRGVSAVIGARALAGDPAEVGALAGSFVDGMAQAGMAATGKHFPGHGAVAPDTHLAVAVDERPRAALDEDLAPFATLAPRLGAVMLAHVIYPAVDDAPAGYSARWIGGVLRGEIGFLGAAVSDDLGMAGGAGPGDLIARAQAALDAGCDAVLVCNALDAVDDLLAGLRWRSTPAHAARVTALAGGPGVRPGDAVFRAAQALLAAM
jgi:beta-N-acetylhexosaminidase